MLQHPADEAPHQWPSPLYVIVLHEAMVEVGVELLGNHEIASEDIVVDVPDYPVGGGLEVAMAPVRPTSIPGNRRHGMGRGAPHLLRALQIIAGFELAVGRFEEVLCRLYVLCRLQLSHCPFQADAQELLRLHGELERQLLEYPPTEAVDDHVVGLLL